MICFKVLERLCGKMGNICIRKKETQALVLPQPRKFTGWFWPIILFHPSLPQREVMSCAVP